MNDSSHPRFDGRKPVSGRHFLELPQRPLTSADVWTALPSSRREPAQDYLAQGRVTHRCRRGAARLALVRGYQDDYHVYCEDVAAGWQVGCSCARRMPCAHVGGLLLAVAESPESFRAWSDVMDQLGSAGDWAWTWARGGDFPWPRAEDLDRMVLAPGAADDPLPARVVDLSAAQGARLAPLLLDVGRRAHAGWWEHPEFVRAVTAAVDKRRQHGVEPAELVEWVALVAREPRIPAGPLFLGEGGRHPAVRAAWIRELMALDAAHALQAKPSQALAARALLDLPIADGPDPGWDPVWLSRFAWALPAAGLPAAERLLHLGRPSEAWWALLQSADPRGDEDFRGDGPGTPSAYRAAIANLIRRHITGGA